MPVPAVPVPDVPGATFVVIEAEFILCGLKAFFDPPTCAFDLDQRLNGGSRWAPCGEIGLFAIGKATPDQQATGPKAGNRRVKFVGIEIG